ncbi:MAG: substrate-binding domain-containing protein [Steroidobacteraceae bacterium]
MAALLAQERPPPRPFSPSTTRWPSASSTSAHRTGRSVPESLSVIGFDDIRFARYVRPALTTISQPMLDIGRETVRLLLGILQGKVAKPVSVTLPHKLEIRASTAAPPRAANKS